MTVRQPDTLWHQRSVSCGASVGNAGVVSFGVLGIDIGGTHLRAGLVNVASGDVVGSIREAATPTGGSPERTAVEIANICEGWRTADDGECGCTFPGRVRAGVALTAVNLDPSWVGNRPGSVVEAKLGRPVHVLNDADAAGLAEVTFGAAAGRRGVVVMLTLGTGVGSALFHDGALVPNVELGELMVNGALAGEVASLRAKNELGLSWDEWAAGVANFIDVVQDVVDPDVIVIGGGASEQPDKLLPALRQEVVVLPAALGNRAGVIGAALYAASLTNVARRSRA